MIATIELYTVAQLAAFLKKKPSTIYTNINRKPECLPPIFYAPGSGRPLFVNPQQWVAGIVFPDLVNSQPPQALVIAPTKKRGRPSNAEKLAK
jgi:hypothetical protein